MGGNVHSTLGRRCEPYVAAHQARPEDLEPLLQLANILGPPTGILDIDVMTWFASTPPIFATLDPKEFNGEVTTSQQCLVRAIELHQKKMISSSKDSTEEHERELCLAAAAWNALGVVLRNGGCAAVSKRAVYAQDCFIEALSFHRKQSSSGRSGKKHHKGIFTMASIAACAWTNLAWTLLMNEPHTVSLSQNEDGSWRRFLGFAGDASPVAVSSLSSKTPPEKNLDTTIAAAAPPQHHHVDPNGPSINTKAPIVFTSRDCALQGLKLQGGHGLAWYTLGDSLTPSETVLLQIQKERKEEGENKDDQKEHHGEEDDVEVADIQRCCVEALRASGEGGPISTTCSSPQLSPTAPTTTTTEQPSLASDSPKKQEVSFNISSKTGKIHSSVLLSDLWFHLSISLITETGISSGDDPQKSKESKTTTTDDRSSSSSMLKTIEVAPGYPLTAVDCLRRALHHDPLRAQAWMLLGDQLAAADLSAARLWLGGRADDGISVIASVFEDEESASVETGVSHPQHLPSNRRTPPSGSLQPGDASPTVQTAAADSSPTSSQSPALSTMTLEVCGLWVSAAHCYAAAALLQKPNDPNAASCWIKLGHVVASVPQAAAVLTDPPNPRALDEANKEKIRKRAAAAGLPDPTVDFLKLLREQKAAEKAKEKEQEVKQLEENNQLSQKEEKKTAPPTADTTAPPTADTASAGEEGMPKGAVGCYVRGLKLNPDAADGWRGLGAALREGTAARLDTNVKVSRVECFRRAVILRPGWPLAWRQLAQALTHRSLISHTTKIRQQQCQGSDDDSNVAPIKRNALPEELMVAIRGKSITPLKAFRRALQLAPDDGAAWLGLGIAISEFRAGVPLDIVSVLTPELATLLQPALKESPEMWKFSPVQCYLLAVHFDPQLAAAWLRLGIAIAAGPLVPRPNGTVGVPGTQLLAGGHVTRIECFARAAGAAPGAMGPWCCLAAGLGPRETIPFEESIVQEAEELFSMSQQPAASDDPKGEKKPVEEESTTPPRKKQRLNPIECGLLALRRRPTHQTAASALAWTAMGVALKMGQLPPSAVAHVRSQFETSDFSTQYTAVEQMVYSHNVDINVPVSLSKTITFEGHPWSTQACFEHALKLNPAAAGVWTHVGSLLGNTTTIIAAKAKQQGVPQPKLPAARINGKAVTRRECFEASATLRPQIANTWYMIATTLGEEALLFPDLSAPTTQKPHVTKPHPSGHDDRAAAAEEPVVVSDDEHDEDLSSAPVAPGARGPRGPNAKVGGRTYTRQQCYIEAILLLPSHASAWLGLGFTVARDGIVSVGGEWHTKQSCFLAALKLQPTKAVIWFHVASTLYGDSEIIINDLVHNRVECLLESLLHDPTYGASWLALAKNVNIGERVDVNGTFMTKQQCYVRAVVARPKDPSAWVGLGVTVTARDGGFVAIPKQIAGDILEQPELLSFVEKNKRLSQQELDGKTTQKEKNEEGSTTRDRPASSARNVHPDQKAAVANSNAVSQFNGLLESEKVYLTATDCYVKAIKLDAANSPAWFNLGTTLPTNDTHAQVELKSASEFTKASVNRLQCFRRAIELDLNNAKAWFNFGVNLPEWVPDVHRSGQPEPATASPGDPMADINVVRHPSLAGNSRASGSTNGGRRVSRMECYVRALRAEPNMAMAWAQLAQILPEGATVDVGRERNVTKAQCHERAKSLVQKSMQDGTVLAGGSSAAAASHLDTTSSSSSAATAAQPGKGEEGCTIS